MLRAHTALKLLLNNSYKYATQVKPLDITINMEPINIKYFYEQWISMPNVYIIIIEPSSRDIIQMVTRIIKQLNIVIIFGFDTTVSYELISLTRNIHITEFLTIDLENNCSLPYFISINWKQFNVNIFELLIAKILHIKEKNTIRRCSILFCLSSTLSTTSLAILSFLFYFSKVSQHYLILCTNKKYMSMMIKDFINMLRGAHLLNERTQEDVYKHFFLVQPQEICRLITATQYSSYRCIELLRNNTVVAMGRISLLCKEDWCILEQAENLRTCSDEFIEYIKSLINTQTSILLGAEYNNKREITLFCMNLLWTMQSTFICCRLKVILSPNSIPILLQEIKRLLKTAQVILMIESHDYIRVNNLFNYCIAFNLKGLILLYCSTTPLQHCFTITLHRSYTCL